MNSIIKGVSYRIGYAIWNRVLVVLFAVAVLVIGLINPERVTELLKD